MGQTPFPRLFKAVASGNDFLLADARGMPGSWDAGEDGARRLCDRREGVGADGLVVLGPSREATASFMLRNCDGSPAAFSGNGARCAALLLGRLGAGAEVTLATPAGVRRCRLVGKDRVEISLGAPRDVRPEVALPDGSPSPVALHADVGVPYLALRMESRQALQALDVERVAPPLRRWSALPSGANVAFWCAREDGSLDLRTFERGVEAETRSSGTGCAAVALAHALALPARGPELRVALHPPSGDPLVVTVAGAPEVQDLRLLGDARLVAEISPAP